MLGAAAVEEGALLDVAEAAQAAAAAAPRAPRPPRRFVALREDLAVNQERQYARIEGQVRRRGEVKVFTAGQVVSMWCRPAYVREPVACSLPSCSWVG